MGSSVITITKAELFAYAYVRHHGNGTLAALEVFNINGKEPKNTANVMANEYLRKPTVQTIIKTFLTDEKQTMSFVVDQLMEMIKSDKNSYEQRLKALVVLARLNSYELEDSLYTPEKAKIKSQERIEIERIKKNHKSLS